MDKDQKITRLYGFLNELTKAITNSTAFPFGSAIPRHKITWNPKCSGLRSLLLENDIIAPNELMRNAYILTAKAKQLKPKELTELVYQLLEEAAAGHANRESGALIRGDDEDQEASEEGQEEQLEETPVVNFDEVERALIKLGLRRIIEEGDELYQPIAQRAIEKIDS